MAEGLSDQEAQAQHLTIGEIVQFLETPGDAPERILNAFVP